ncbi:hypothetical protein C8Q74DRAFT_1306677 [Fomes fomentarius]|nr:hypothetical protein C8Q74DRAFT_1306677 [Fomes fomentarius]
MYQSLASRLSARCLEFGDSVTPREDTRSLLPPALYICCNLGGAVLDEWAREDGTIEHLSEQDLRLCINGSCALVRRGLDMLGDFREPMQRRMRCASALHAAASV